MTTDLRATILDLVRRFPALHVREIERHLALPDRLAAYHLAGLAHDGLVQRVQDRGYVRFYASDAGFSPAEMRVARILRREHAYKIALLLLRTKQLSPGDIATALGLARATVSYHLALLTKADLLERRDAGRKRYYSLREPQRTRALLHDLPPLPGAVDEFSSLWDDLVG
jgi:predicted transcriptional regulator